MKKLAIKTCLVIIDVSIVKCIGKHSIAYAVVQDRLASSLKQFILGVTGNVELAKDSLHKNSNFMGENSIGSLFCAKFLTRRIRMASTLLISSNVSMSSKTDSLV